MTTEVSINNEMLFNEFTSTISNYINEMTAKNGNRKKIYPITLDLFGNYTGKVNIKVDKRDYTVPSESRRWKNYTLEEVYDRYVRLDIKHHISHWEGSGCFSNHSNYKRIEEIKKRVNRIEGFIIKDGVMTYKFGEDPDIEPQCNFLDAVKKFVNIGKEYNKHYKEVASSADVKNYRSNEEIDFTLIDEYLDILVEHCDTIKLSYYDTYRVESDEKGTSLRDIKDFKNIKNEVHNFVNNVAKHCEGVNGVIPAIVKYYGTINLVDFFEYDLLDFQLTYNDGKIAKMKYLKEEEDKSIDRFYSHYVVDHYTGD